MQTTSAAGVEFVDTGGKQACTGRQTLSESTGPCARNLTTAGISTGHRRRCGRVCQPVSMVVLCIRISLILIKFILIF